MKIIRRYLARLAGRFLNHQARQKAVSERERVRQVARKMRRELGMPEHPGLHQ